MYGSTVADDFAMDFTATERPVRLQTALRMTP